MASKCGCGGGQTGASQPSQSKDPNEILDPFCDPDKPVKVTLAEVKKAEAAIKGGVRLTPCLESHLSELSGMDIFLKKEFVQYTGSFKERGARYAMLMLSDKERKNGVIAASAGNHAQAMSYHGHDLGIPVTVVMPEIAPIMKVQKCRDYHANVIVQGKDMTDAKRIAQQLGIDKGMIYINGYDHPHILAGQGTAGLEILEQVENVDAIVVPIGGGGLLAGIAMAVKAVNPKVKIIGVEPEKAACWTAAVKNGKPTFVQVSPTLADGLAVALVGYNSWETAKDKVDKVVTVKEEHIAIAILRLIEKEKNVVEGAGASGLAAVLSGQLDEFKGKRVVLVLSGGNIDTTVLGRCLERGLAADGRLVKCMVTVSDRPGGISDLCKLFTSIGVTIKDIIQERAWIKSDVFSVKVIATCETRDYKHSLEMHELLQSQYKEVEFEDFPSQ